MSVANLEEIKKKYNFKQISVATWRDPRGSILPSRGGPISPTISAEAASRPYVPTYKVSYPQPKPPEPTDDEDSGDDEDAGSDDEAKPVEPPRKFTEVRMWSA